MLSFKLSKYPNTYLNSRHPFCIHIQDRIHIRVKMWYKMLSEFDSISASIHKKMDLRLYFSKRVKPGSPIRWGEPASAALRP
jgi:hypothetical protein